MASGFSFDFLPTTAANESSTAVETTQAVEQTRRPFAWLANTAQLLHERSEQEIVYRDINVHHVSYNDDDVDDDVDDGVNDPSRRTTQLRQVDWKLSSFVSATDADAPQEQQEALWQQTDKYEGGMKVWECSLDLVRYLATQQEADLMSITGGQVLELGCGHGLPACFMLQQAIRKQQQQQEPEPDDNSSSSNKNKQKKPPPLLTVMYVDYNDFVLKDVTVSNIVINAAAADIAIEDVVPHVLLGAGDWLELSKQLLLLQAQSQSKQLDPTIAAATAAVIKEEEESTPIPATTMAQLPTDGKLDCILAAETIYSDQAARDTATFCVRHVRLTTGVAWIATKRYYFGVGGGSEAFRQGVKTAAASQDVTAVVETVQVYDNGTSNIRELLRVQCFPRADE